MAAWYNIGKHFYLIYIVKWNQFHQMTWITLFEKNESFKKDSGDFLGEIICIENKLHVGMRWTILFAMVVLNCFKILFKWLCNVVQNVQRKSVI